VPEHPVHPDIDRPGLPPYNLRGGNVHTELPG